MAAKLTWDRWHARARLRCSRSIRLRAETEGLSSISRSRGAKVGDSERTTWQRVPKSHTSCLSAANLIRSLRHARARLRGSRSIRLRAVIEGLSSTSRSRGAKVVVRAWQRACAEVAHKLHGPSRFRLAFCSHARDDAKSRRALYELDTVPLLYLNGKRHRRGGDTRARL